MNVIGVIPARSGSKGLLGKNMMTINGTSLIGWVSHQLSINRKISKKIISTDSDLYGREAMLYGVTYEFRRPDFLSSDSSSIFDVIEDVFIRYPSFDYVLLLQPTQPFVTQGTIDNVLRIIEDANPTSVITSYPLSGSTHPSWSFIEDKTGDVSWLDANNHFKRRQELVELKRRAGSVYAFSKEAISNYVRFGKSPYGDKVISTPVSAIEAVSIDDEFDFLWATTLATHQKIKIGS